MLEPQSLYEAMQGIDEVYHCAALVSYRSGDAEELLRSNVVGTRNVVNMALEAGVRRLLHVSSTAVLGGSSCSSLIGEVYLGW